MLSGQPDEAEEEEPPPPHEVLMHLAEDANW